MPHTYDYEMPAVTVDAIVMRRRIEPEEDVHTTPPLVLYRTEILLIKRKNDPFKDKWAFPGGFVDKFEEPAAACAREVKEETGITVHRTDLFDVVGQKDRDPRGWTMSIVFKTEVPWDTEAVANDDAIEARWFNVCNLPSMAFDHKDIMDHFVCRLVNGHQPIRRGEIFGTSLVEDD